MGIQWRRAALLVVGAAVMASPALTHAGEGIIGYRHEVMEAIGGHTSALGAIIKKDVPFSEDARIHAQALAALAPIVSKIFPAGSDKGETDALPAVWTKPEEFKKEVAAFQAAAAELGKVADAPPADMAPAFSALVKTCKSCHDGFRKKS
jgi:cytochrome c556